MSIAVWSCFEGSLSAVKLEKLVRDKRLSKDIAKLSGEHQTSKVEAFHSLIIQFAPKMYVYSYTGMLCRYVSLIVYTNAIPLLHTTPSAR